MSTKADNSRRQQPSPSILQRIRRHRRAFLTYDRLAPLADPMDTRFVPDRVNEARRWQSRENRHRLALLAAKVHSHADMRAKAAYCLRYSGCDYLISGPEEVGIFLEAIAADHD